MYNEYNKIFPYRIEYIEEITEGFVVKCYSKIFILNEKLEEIRIINESLSSCVLLNDTTLIHKTAFGEYCILDLQHKKDKIKSHHDCYFNYLNF